MLPNPRSESSRKLYGIHQSGNVYKVRLMLSLLDLPYEWIGINLAAKEHRSPEFLQLNPIGQVPVLVDANVNIRDSQAILVYLARKYDNNWLPIDAEYMAKIIQWLSIAANEIEHSLTALRRHFLLGAPIDRAKAERTAKQLLQVMDQHLENQPWLECHHPTIADIACYPYIYRAVDSQIDLSPYLNIITWLNRIQQLPGYIAM
ncbi:glutathione S-transferase family protein [Leptolyngbya sp. 7M]|uniref:glutathione S-transferase family protein n=1 Tax=Leptolyngbya sp. 7M TaxID=2812896 RepID=UPI001B8B5D25|nr:glutathione S-transferase family protein [Leptolyngbya sp. 7M]QYO65140.1 glutathione S-transferase family protein [Leptolyngbya sp. 7M]